MLQCLAVHRRDKAFVSFLAPEVNNLAFNDSTRMLCRLRLLIHKTTQSISHFTIVRKIKHKKEIEKKKN